jgi:hypothetical protein
MLRRCRELGKRTPQSARLTGAALRLIEKNFTGAHLSQGWTNREVFRGELERWRAFGSGFLRGYTGGK